MMRRAGSDVMPCAGCTFSPTLGDYVPIRDRMRTAASGATV